MTKTVDLTVYGAEQIAGWILEPEDAPITAGLIGARAAALLCEQSARIQHLEAAHKAACAMVEEHGRELMDEYPGIPHHGAEREREAFRLLNAATFYVPFGRELLKEIKAWMDESPRAAHAEDNPTDWQPIETAPRDVAALFWVRPGTTEDGDWYCDTSGNPILAKTEPYAILCKYGAWSSLMKGTHWMPVTGPAMNRTAPHDPKCKPDFPFHLCPICYPNL